MMPNQWPSSARDHAQRRASLGVSDRGAATRTLVPRTLVALGALAAGAGWASPARAQVDIDPPVPNVLLLIDTSGSMEHMANGQTVEAAGATCSPGVPTPMNRWATLLSVMSGTIQNFSCQSLDRKLSTFLNEYRINGVDPYDHSYYLPFHRPLSAGCAIGPGVLPPSWQTWPVPLSAFKAHPFNDQNGTCAAGGWAPSYDGILDVFGDRVRFGLMTFDTLPDDSTGVSGNTWDLTGGNSGMWSYYANWSSVGSPATGHPPNCAGLTFEVGARNEAAPPWEGRMVPFGPYAEPAVEARARNEFIQQSLIAMRPFGATPLAGMLDDAKSYLFEATGANAPSGDPFVSGGCRKNFIIVLSDGEPNMDLRPDCAAPGGDCPYDKPELIARSMWVDPDAAHRVQTFVIGFGLSSAAGVDCAQMNPAVDFAPGGVCTTASTSALKACCTLNRIAYEGGSERAYFADDLGTLKQSLSQVLAAITAGSTSRTLPVFSGATSSALGSSNAPAASYQFVSSFDVSGGTTLWRGNLERKRYVCENQPGVGLTAVLKSIDPSKGDDFSANVNSNDGARPRKFFSVIRNGEVDGSIRSDRSVRPALSADDGLGLAGGAVTGGGLQSGGDFAFTLRTSPRALGIDPTLPPASCSAQLSTNDGAVCAERLVRWHVGEVNPGIPQTRDQAACPTGSTCSELGSIYHATPVVVGAPREFLRDESYSAFATEQATRPIVLYTATTDGQLHAFKVAPGAATDNFKVDQLQNNELWSFFPPTVLPQLFAGYEQQALLLDGAPVVKDVVFSRSQAVAALGGFAGGATWRTVLVGGGGPAGGFYYALDVTDPTQPKFLWQLSTDNAGGRLFGRSVPSPTITTVALRDGANIKEVAVAVLAGGSAPLLGDGCPRQPKSYSHIQTQGPYGVRNTVRCWDNTGAQGPGRSLTIVRVDTGEVLMSFRGAVDEGPAALLAGGRAKVVPFDSPITGVPVAYPSQTGQVATRIYVGDADGTLWKVDVSSNDPANWTADLAWDGYALSGDTSTMSEPIQTPPIVSVDPTGNYVILFSTGDQEQFANGNSAQTRVWSITEEITNGAARMKDNWVIPLDQGRRVTGPMALFNSIAYFATFTPTDANISACSNGYGSIWGVDYRLAQNGAPLARYAIDPNNLAAGYVTHKDQPQGTAVFGVGVTQTPSCSETEVYNDPYLGSRVSVSNASGGEFQLVFQTGKGGTSSENSKTNTVTERLPRPRETTRVDSWAGIIE